MPVRIALVTVGSLGDVQPIFALAAGLQRAGHEVRVVAHAQFGSTAAALGLTLRSTAAADPRRLLESEEGQALLAKKNPLRLWRGFAALAEASARTLVTDTLEACDGVDAVGYSGIAVFPSYAVAERLGLPYFAAHVIPVGPVATSEFPSPLLPPGFSWIPGYNAASHGLAKELVWRWFAPLADRLRGRPAGSFPSPAELSRGARAVLFGISPAVLPLPSVWSARVSFTGYWFLDDAQARTGWTPSAELLRFLEQGPPPIVVGFGSMRGPDPERRTNVVLEAVERAGVRAILLFGWGGLAPRDLPPHVLGLDHAPHGWLYPRAAAVVHHGGAGTTGAGLRAGRPTVIVPFAFDQPFWGAQVFRLGAGPRPIPENMLTPNRLCEAIRRTIEDGRIAAAAREIGERIQSEDGVATAVRAIERGLEHRQAM